MGLTEIVAIVSPVVSCIFIVLWWFARKTVSDTAGQVSDLYDKHEKLVNELSAHRVKVAVNYVMAANSVLQLQHNGTQWFEIGRAA